MESKSHDLQYPDAFCNNEFVFMVSSSDCCCDERWVEKSTSTAPTSMTSRIELTAMSIMLHQTSLE